MAKKPLPSPELLRKLLRYDPETGTLYWRERDISMFTSGRNGASFECSRWNTRYAGRQAFTATNTGGYHHGPIAGFRLPAHRIIWAMAHGQWPEGHVDHINGIRTDNRIANLRVVCPAGNARNKRRYSSNASGHTGVRWYKPLEKWVAQIRGDGRIVHLGYYSDMDDAIAARLAAERRYGFHPNHGRK
jgi:hypothetical protein